MPSASPLPVVFVGHGSPMNAIEDNPWSRAQRALGAALPRPRAILAVSAHWFVPALRTTAQARPETIHDFGGFPRPLYEVQYPAPGDAALARRAAALAGEAARAVEDWGLDHGTWSVLVHLRPAADVPVVQLSLDARLSPAEHLAVARRLRPLREEGVLVLASGNVTHNLRHAFGSLQSGRTETPAWARRFDEGVALALVRRDAAWLTGALEGEDGRLAHPSPDHFLPLLYALGAAGDAGETSFPITGFDLASLSMRCAVLT